MQRRGPFMFVIVIMVTLLSCDYVHQPYTVPGPNGCTVPEPDFTPRTNPVRKVLVEDFTGHKCGACPNGHIVLDNLHNQYGEQVVAIALHSSIPSQFTAPVAPNPENKFIYDFRTNEATEIDDKFGISSVGIPNGMINRKKFDGTHIITHTIWPDKVSSELSLPPLMDIQIKNFYTAADESICSYAYVEALENLNSNYQLVMLITEDSIITWQKFYGQIPDEISNYEHNHVVRGSLTGTFGVPIADGKPLKEGESFIDGYSISITGKDWNIDQLNVVAFVYDVATDEIIQAELVKLIP